MASLTSIDYRVKHKGGRYDFTIRLVYDPALRGAAAYRWEILKPSPLAPLEILAMTGGDWDYSPPFSGITGSGSGFISLYDGRTRMLDIYLNDVPKDYLHGDFCLITSGPAEYMRGTSTVPEIEWTVSGPGCV